MHYQRDQCLPFCLCWLFWSFKLGPRTWGHASLVSLSNFMPSFLQSVKKQSTLKSRKTNLWKKVFTVLFKCLFILGTIFKEFTSQLYLLSHFVCFYFSFLVTTMLEMAVANCLQLFVNSSSFAVTSCCSVYIFRARTSCVCCLFF